MAVLCSYKVLINIMSSHHAIKIFHLISQCKTVTRCQSFWNMIFWHHVISLHFFRQTAHQEIISERILLYLYFFHQISPSDAVICVHFSHFNNKLSRRGNGSFSDRRSHMGFAPLWSCGPVVGTRLDNTISATGSVRVLLHRVKRLLLKQLPPGKPRDKHACAFELSSVE